MKTLELILDRRYPKDKYTIGILTCEGKRICEVLELPVKGTHHGKTAIPAGRYEIDMNTVSPKFATRFWAAIFKGIVPWLKNVPGRSRILIHPGNSVEDTDGCLLPGNNREKGKVLDSSACYLMLIKGYLRPAAAAGRQIFITIKDHE